MARLPKDNILPIIRITIRNSEKIQVAQNKVLEFLEIQGSSNNEFLNFVNTSKEWEYLSFLITGNPEGEITKGDLGNYYKLINKEVFKISENELGNSEKLQSLNNENDDNDGNEEVNEMEEDLGPSPSIYPEGPENNEYEILNEKTKKELLNLAKFYHLEGVSRISKHELILQIMNAKF